MRSIAHLWLIGASCLGSQFCSASDAIHGVPLAARSQPAGATLFTNLSADGTGIRSTNLYADPQMWNERYHEFEIGAIGTGIAIGDYDNDGRPDVFVVSKTESCRLFRNLGGWKFEDVSEKSGVADHGNAALIWKQGAAFADVNNDGLLDLYVCRNGAPNLLYINQGNGTFKESAKAAGLDISDGSATAAFCDYDRDGWLDVYVQTNLLNNSTHPGGQPDYLFHNNRDGTFTNVTRQAGISGGDTQGNSVTWWDFNNDGWPDIYVANDFAVPDALYRNNADGTFTNVIDATVPHMPYSSMGADLGDLNNDGRIDFLVADMAASSHVKDQRTMADTRSRTKDPAAGSTATPNYLHNSLFVNTGTSRTLEAAYLAGLAATDWTWSVRFEDLDNDGRLDVHITNGMHREIHNTDLILKMMTTENAAERIRVAYNSPVLAENNFAFRNLGDLRFQDVSATWGLNQLGVSFGAAFGDLDGDGDLDLVYGNFLAGPTVLRNDSVSGHRILIDLRGTISNRFGIGAVVTLHTRGGIQTRQLVVTRGFMSSSEPAVHFGLGEDTVVDRLTVAWPSGQLQEFINMAVDRRYTITEPGGPAQIRHPPPPEAAATQFREISATKNLSWRSGEVIVDELAQQRLLPMRQNRRGPALAVADINGDDRDDVVIGGTVVDGARLLLGSPDGPYVPAGDAIAGTAGSVDCGPVLLFEANGDGHLDLLVTKGGNNREPGSADYQPALFLNTGNGLQAAPPDSLPSVPASIGATAASDFDRNGTLDLFLGARVLPGSYPLAPRSFLLANRGGRFEDVTDSVAPGLRNMGMVTAALWSDVDGDGWPDLVVTLEWGQVKHFHNHEGRILEDATESSGFATAGSGWWSSIASADFNRDGRPDFVVGNVGLNTQFHADANHPAAIYFGEFQEGLPPFAIEATYVGEKLYPWRSRKELGRVIPDILKRFPRNDIYARSTLDEILGPKKLAAAIPFMATEMRSGVLMSQPDGKYHYAPLPRLAQIAPLQGIAAGDFDGDGNADIYAIQNSYAPAPVVGRFDGGLSQLLIGDGAGHFTAVPPVESGLMVPGDGKAVVMVDLNNDAWPDFVVSRNNSTTLAFENQPRPGHNSLCVRLHGPPSNPNGIGSRVTVQFADGTSQFREVTAGSSLYSQSSPNSYFGFPMGATPQSITVRWPSGASTTEPVPAGAKLITVSIEER